uniref:N(6)-L-threonylcarbamoyladenine synthase n=1 Tax=Podospora anserina (strain S / ATCC MYA-4624 / DSM 980 / FGSC 10383) TaxID=515849 RepID=A0A090CEG0_PODAN|nr:Putative glycoprotease [Podospora anserina S mat+]
MRFSTTLSSGPPRYTLRTRQPLSFNRHCRYLSSGTHHKSLLTIAIETSCDDTCVAILEKAGPAARLQFNKRIPSNHVEFKGIHPTIASKSHEIQLAKLVNEAVQSLPKHTNHSPEVKTISIRDPQTGKSTPRRLPDFVSVTRGPGFPRCLDVGLGVAKGLSVAWQVPFLGVHHMQGHALTPRLDHALQQPFPPSSSTPSSKLSPKFPFLTLLASGGHTQLLLSTTLTTHTILATVTNISLGDMLDKAAREILPPSLLSSLPNIAYAAALEQFAFPSPSYKYTPPPNRHSETLPSPLPSPPFEPGWSLTPPLPLSKEMTFNFSGFGGQVQELAQFYPHTKLDRVRAEESNQILSPPSLTTEQRRILARETMRLAFEHLASRVVFALRELQPVSEADKRHGTGRNDLKRLKGLLRGGQKIETLVLSGGVASNKFLRHVLRSVLDQRGWPDIKLAAPPVSLCTDNAAMIAWAGMEMFETEGVETDLGVRSIQRWSLDGSLGEEGTRGVMGVDGWLKRQKM